MAVRPATDTRPLIPGLRDPLLDGTVKGWPDLGVRAGELEPGALTLEDLPCPVLYVRAAPLEHNLREMAAWCARHEMELAPHVKTTMAPDLMRMQLAAGASGLTVADVRQARVALASGAREVLIANEVTAAADLDWIAAVGATARVMFCVDSRAGISLAEAAHRRSGGPALRVLVELGYDGGRGGARTVAQAAHLAALAHASPHLALAGVEAYEGLMRAAEGREPLERVDRLLAAAAELAGEIAALADVPDPILTAGGSAYFDRVARAFSGPCRSLGWRGLLRSGCYLTHDHGLYRDCTPSARGADAPVLAAAIEVRAEVLSRPERERVILGCGRRDVSYDAGLPVALAPAGAAAHLRLCELNDQHAHALSDGEDGLGPGDVVTLGISHPCTALERWRVIALVDPGGALLRAMTTYF